MNASRTEIGMVTIGIAAEGKCQRKSRMTMGDDDHFLDELAPEGFDRPFDQLRTVVSRHDLDSGGQGRLDLLELVLDPVDDVQGVLSGAHDDNAANGIALAVEVGDATPDLGTQDDLGDIPDEDRGPGHVVLNDDRFDVLDRLGVAAAPDHVFFAGELHQPAADVVIPVPDSLDDLHQGNVIGLEGVGVDVDLILFLEASDGSDFGDPGDALEPVTHVPVLEAPELGQVVLARFVDEGILIDPPHARRIGPHFRLGRLAGAWA